MFSAMLFIITKTWKPPKCPLMDKWIKIHVYISHNGILFSYKKNEILSFVTT